LALLIVPVLLAYSNIFNAEFTFDDNDIVLGNPTLKHLWPPSLWQGYVSSNTYLNQTIYTRPVVQFTFALNYALGGFAPWGYHVANLAIHLCSTVLVFGIVRRTLLTAPLLQRFGEATLGVAFVAALLWGVHPLGTMDVTYTSTRMESLMALFYLLTLYSWIRGVQERSRGWLAASVWASFLGMMSKEVMVTAPVLVFLYDGLFLAGSWRQALRQRRLWYVGLVLSTALLAFLVLTVPGEHGAFLSSATAPNQRGAYSDRWSYAATMPGVILYYLRLMAWPDPLVFDYKWPVAASWTTVVLPGLVIAVAAMAALWGLVRRQPWTYPILWYLIVLLPSSSVMPLYDDYIMEYRAYLPSIGPIVLVVCVAWLVLQKIGTTAHRRNLDYRTNFSLWKDTAAKAPDNERARRGFADALLNHGRYDDAIKEYREALRLNPGNVLVLSDLGKALVKQGRPAEGIEHFRAVLRTNPNDADAYYNVGIAFAQQGQSEQAIEAYQNVLRLEPHNNQAHNNLGAVYRNQGRNEEAAGEFRSALQQNPADALAAFNLASVLEQLGRLDEANGAARIALRIAPQDADNHSLLAGVLVKQGKLSEAMQECREAARLQPTAAAYNNLALVLSLQGDREGAVQALRKALEIDPNNADARKNIGSLLSGK
jgi:tetratricopeptide (TPR) repeat protein